MSAIVIVGAGHAGVQLAESLRANGHEGEIVLVDRAPHIPYQRPPLSKDYMSGGGDAAPLPLRANAFYDSSGIELRLGSAATRIDAAARLLELADGSELRYDELVLALGADARTPGCDGAELSGIHVLRTVEDAAALRRALDDSTRVVVVGAGFIGLEFAAAASARGHSVTVIDMADRAMQRALSPTMSAHFEAVHAGAGSTLVFGEGLAAFEGDAHGRVSAVIGTSGERYEADLVVAGLGVTTAEALAADAGVATDRGILVDELLATSVPHIWAIGDVAVFPSVHSGGALRLESVQNAGDMAKALARTLTGEASAYTVPPWFWSNQGAAKLQIVGLSAPGDEAVVRGAAASGRFSVLLFRAGRLVAVESVNAPGDHVAARTLIEHAGGGVTPEQAADASFDLKGHARALKLAGVSQLS